MSSQLWIAVAVFICAMVILAALRGIRAAALTSVILLAIGIAYFLITRAFQSAGKWILALLILIAGAAVFFARSRRKGSPGTSDVA